MDPDPTPDLPWLKVRGLRRNIWKCNYFTCHLHLFISVFPFIRIDSKDRVGHVGTTGRVFINCIYIGPMQSREYRGQKDYLQDPWVIIACDV